MMYISFHAILCIKDTFLPLISTYSVAEFKKKISKVTN